MAELIGRQFDPALSWRDIAWVQEHWDGPLLIKGILRGDDARQAASLGLAGVIVSNHGGRQLDHATSTIRALPEIVDAAGGELEVYMDGGIRRGVDIIRALALGARGVLAGRALVYGLAAGGPAGAQRAMQILVDELRLAMTLLGCPSVRELDSSWVTARGRERDEERMEHVIDPTRVHHAWNRDREPTLRIADGDSVRFALRMAGAEQIREGDSYADTNFIADQIYWLLGPVYVEGARPGDTLRVDILALRPGEWGWCGTEPGPRPAPRPTSRSRSSRRLTCADATASPCAPRSRSRSRRSWARWAPIPTSPANCPRSRPTAAAATLTPATSPWAARCGCRCGARARCSPAATRTGRRATARSAWPRWSATWTRRCASASSGGRSARRDSSTAGALTPRVEGSGHHGTMGIGPDLMEGARAAVRETIAWLVDEHGLSREDAYVTCSLAGDLKLLEVVDAGVWNVGFTLPLSILRGVEMSPPTVARGGPLG